MFYVSICYGKPADPAAFDDYYTNTHVPLALKVPGLVSFTTGKCQPLGRVEPPYYMVANLGFETAETMKTALTSPQMGAASSDVPNFATGGATLYSAEETVIIR
jgi:uncharacterized protein (TIGR02118 family)